MMIVSGRVVVRGASSFLGVRPLVATCGVTRVYSSSSNLFQRAALEALSERSGRKKGGSSGGGKDAKSGGKQAEDDVDAVQLRASTVDGLKDKLAFSLDRLKKDFAQINAGRASPDLLARVVVDAYGAKEPLAKVAQVAVKDPQNLMVNVFDPSLVKAVSDSIRDAGLQLNPQGLRNYWFLVRHETGLNFLHLSVL